MSVAKSCHYREGALCGANLETYGQNGRLRMGVFFLAVGLVMALGFEVYGASRGWRLSLFVPFFMGAFGAFQGLYRTCPTLAAKGTREGVAPGNEERVINSADVERSRRLSRKVLAFSLINAVLATSVFVFLP